jgi:hypothetical protein
MIKAGRENYGQDLKGLHGAPREAGGAISTGFARGLGYFGGSRSKHSNRVLEINRRDFWTVDKIKNLKLLTEMKIKKGYEEVGGS